MASLIKLAAQRYAEIEAALRASKDPLTANDLLEKPAIAAVANKQQLWTALVAMKQKDMLRAIRVNRPNDPSRWAYELTGNTTAPKPKPQRTTQMDITVGKDGDYVEVVLKGLKIRIAVSD